MEPQQTANADSKPAAADASNESRHIRIFDTTLRDGEQSPGASMNLAEKLEVALVSSRKSQGSV